MKQYLIPIVFIFMGVICGYFVEKIIDNHLHPLTDSIHTETTTDDIQIVKYSADETEKQTEITTETTTQISGQQILLQSLNNTVSTWFIIAGFYGAFLTCKLDGNASIIFHKILAIASLLSVTIFLAKLSGGFVTLVGQNTQTISASIVSNLTKIAVFSFGILVILQTIGVQITAILTTLGVGGLAIALAVQDTLSNLFAGLYLIISQQFKTGDYVKLETNQEGYVIDISWRTTTIKDISNNNIIIPNSKLSSVIFTNYHLPVKEVVLRVDLGVSYSSNLEYVEQVTVDVAKQVMAEIAPELTMNEPFVRYHNFGESSIDLTVFMRVNEFLDRRLAKHLFIKKLHQRFLLEKIQIPYPTREFFMKSSPDREFISQLNIQV